MTGNVRNKFLQFPGWMCSDEHMNKRAKQTSTHANEATANGAGDVSREADQETDLDVFKANPSECLLAYYIGLHELAKNPHHQFSVVELAIVSGIGQTTLKAIKKSENSPFSSGKCTVARLDAWLDANSYFRIMVNKNRRPLATIGDQ